MRESIQVFIAPPDPAVLRERLLSRGTDSAEAIDARLEVAEQELAAQDEFAHRVVNDDLDRAARRAGGDRARRARLTSRLRRPNDQATRRQTAGARRLALRRGRRRGEAGAPDQQLLPQPRRGRLRRVPAADGRDPERARTTSRWRSRSLPRASSNTSTAPSPAPGRPDRRRKPMARILLGVSGGIAAYKSLELARLATVAGHGVRVVMTESATRFVGAASFEGIVGAPVLISEFERDPMRGAFPGDPRARARPDRPPRARRQLRRLPGRARLGQHDRQARRGHGRLDADHLLPRLRRPAPRRPGDERPHVRGRRDPGQPGDPARARRHRDRARGGAARLARRVRQGPPARPRAAARPRRSRPCPPATGPGTACASWSPRAAPASRSTRSASSATAPAAAWASPSPPPPPAAAPT